MIINSNFFNVIADKQTQPFAWGVNDCCLFVADIYGELYGIDFAEGIRGTYDNEYDGMRTIVELGGYDTILTDRDFYRLDNINFVSRGDVVIAENTLGIWVGDKGLFAGNVTRKLSDITDAYRYKE